MNKESSINAIKKFSLTISKDSWFWIYLDIHNIIESLVNWCFG